MWAACVETGDNHPIARSIVQSWDGCAVAAASAKSMDVELVDGTFAREGRVGVYGQVRTKEESGAGVLVDHIVGVGNAVQCSSCLIVWCRQRHLFEEAQGSSPSQDQEDSRVQGLETERSMSVHHGG